MTDESGYNDLTNLFGIDWYILEGLRLKGSFSLRFKIHSRMCLNLPSILILRNIPGMILIVGDPTRLRGEIISVMMPVSFELFLAASETCD